MLLGHEEISKWRLMLHYGFMLNNGLYINDATFNEFASISYSNIQDLVAMFKFCEIFSKFDWEAAFKQIPIHPLFIFLFIFVFESFRILFSTITFDLSQTPKLFSAFPKAVSSYLISLFPHLFQLKSYPKSTFFKNFPRIFVQPDD